MTLFPQRPTKPRLRLFGLPTLVVGGKEHRITPRKSFELLALLALAPQQKLSRAHVASLLWSQLDRAKRMDHLRPCLSRLKTELSRIEAPHEAESDGTSIWISAPVESDLKSFLDSEGNESCEVSSSNLQEVMAGWDDSVAEPYRNEVESILADRLCLLMHSAQSKSGKARNRKIDAFLKQYPANAKVTAAQYALLVQQGHSSAAQDLVATFEEAWLDKYGYTDLPDIPSLAESSKLVVGSADQQPISRPHLSWSWLWAYVSVAAIAVIIFVVARSRGEVQSHVPTHVLRQATGPYDRIVFDSDEDGNSEIYSMNSDGSDVTRLTVNLARDLQPALSPDGTKIAFVSLRDGNFEIYVMNADGSDQQRLTNEKANDFNPVWSPDGSKIAFMSQRDPPDEIYVMNSDGTDPKRLTFMGGDSCYPSWSPDGQRIAFQCSLDGYWAIYSINADRTDPQRLTHNRANDLEPAWSPDGSKIAFDSNRDGNREIYVMNADGSDQKRLTNNPTIDSCPFWLSGGSRIGFTSDRDGPGDTYVMDSDGTNLRRITSFGSKSNSRSP